MPSPELDTITIKGFKSIASIEKLKLRPINVVIGSNGSGKSNFIGVFSFLHAIREGHLQDYVAKAGGAEKVLHFGSKVTKELYLHISFQNGDNQYEITLQSTQADNLIPKTEWVYLWNKEIDRERPWSYELSMIGKETGISAPNGEGSSIANYVCHHLDSLRLYHFQDTSSSSPMKKTVSLNDNHYLRSDGSNLAAFLYYLREKHEVAYRLIRSTVQLVAPFFDDFQLLPSKLNPDTIILQWRHKNSEAYFDAASFSDGTLRFIFATG